jgi:predicted Zn finger-like uncharacterized protein
VVIACEHCNTRFQLDDARVPESGVRVRCSRCKHAFFVAPPGGVDAGLHAAAAEAATRGEPSGPSPTQDLSPEASDPGVESPVEEDWQFNIPEPGAADAPASGGKSLAFGSLAAPEAAPPLPLPTAEPSHPGGALEDPSLSASEAGAAPFESETWGSGDDLRDELFGTGDLGAPDGESASGTEPDAAADQLFGTSDGELGAEDEEPASPTETDAASGATGPQKQESLADLGSPEDWDFVGDTPASPSRSEPAPATASAAAPVRQVEKSEPVVFAASAASGSRWAVWLDAAVWLACAVLLVAGVAGAWVGSPEVAVRSAPTTALGPLSLQGLRAAIVENVHAGPVWVFRGTLVNLAQEPARADSLPRLVLLDAEGEVVGEAWFGRAVTDEALRERKPVEIAPRTRAATRELGLRSLSPGEQLELTAIVERLPAGAVTWKVEPAVVPPAPTPARSGTLPSLPSSPE